MFDIIIPIFRISETFLVRALDSVKQQSFEEYQVFVIDGTPAEYKTYDAKELVLSYGNQFSYLVQEPTYKLVGGARNQGVYAGNNPYLAFLDGDDYWYKNYLLDMKDEIEKSNDKIKVWSCALDCEFPVYSTKTGYHKVERVYGYYPEYLSVLETHPHLAYYFLLGHPPAPTGTIIERNVFVENNGYDEELGIIEDTELLLRIVGDPRKVSIENRNHYLFCQFIGGYHYIGEENTTKRGKQSGVSALTTDISSYFEENGRKFVKTHPYPVAEDLPKELPDGFLETTKGVMRMRILNA